MTEAAEGHLIWSQDFLTVWMSQRDPQCSTAAISAKKATSDVKANVLYANSWIKAQLHKWLHWKQSCGFPFHAQSHLLLFQLLCWLMKPKEAFYVSTCLQFCSSDVFHVFESGGKVILSDVSYQTDIWLWYTSKCFYRLLSHLISKWRTLYIDKTVILSLFIFHLALCL